MCITNFVRRPRPVAVDNESNNKSAAAATISSRPSLITQRLYNSSTASGGNIRDDNSINCSGNSSSSSRGGVTIQAVSLDALASLPQLLKTNQHEQFQLHQQLLHNPNVVGSNAFGSGHGAATATTTAKKSRRKRKPQKPGLTAKVS